MLVIGFDGADWVLDIVRCELVDGGWRALGGGGGGKGNPPFEAVPGEAPGLALVSRSYRESDDSRVWAAGGFVLGDVQSIELSVGGLARRVAIGPHPTGFVAVIAEVVDDDGDADPDMDLVVVRAFDSAGDLVDDSSRWSKPDLADGTLTLAEALLQPAGSVVTVEGVLLALVGQLPRLCDDIDSAARPPTPIGASLELSDGSFAPSWRPGNSVVATSRLIVTGTVSNAKLVYGGRPEGNAS